MNNKIKSCILLLGMPVVVYLVFRLLAPERFGSFDSIYILLQQSLIYAITGCGCYFIIAMGVFDFSVGAMIIMSCLVGCQLSARFGYVGLIAGCIIVGTLLGLINGFIYSKLRVPSIIVTVGLAIIYECIAFILAGDTINRLGNDIKAFGRAPFNLIAAIVSFAIATYIIKYSRIGIYVRAIGRNETMTKNMGIPVERYKFYGFVICGFFAGVSALITISRNAAVVPVTGMASMSRNFQPFMGCFVGIAFKRYINPVASILLSEFMISMVVSGVMTIGLDSTLQNCIIGGILLAVVVIMSSEQRKQHEVVK